MTSENGVERLEALLPPHSLEAEQAVLGSVLLDPTCIVRVAEDLEPDAFYSIRHGAVFGAMLALARDGLAPDLASVTDRLRQFGTLERAGGLDYLLDLDNATATARFIDQHIARVRETWDLRRLISRAQWITELAYRGEPSGSEIVARAQQALAELANRQRLADRQFPFVIPGLQPEPPPRLFRLDPLIPEGAATLLYGDAGLGKSYLAAALGIAIAARLPHFAHMPIIGGRVLYLDAELDAEEFTRRAYQLARGLGLSAPPHDLVYLNLEQSLASPRSRQWLEKAIAAAEADFTIIDSLSFASAGARLNDPGEMTAVLMGLRGVGTLLALDHSNWAGVSGNQSDSHPMGSFFKRAFARSMVQIDRALAGGITLRSNKATFRALPEPIHLALVHEQDRISVQRIDLHDGRMAGADRNMPVLERVFLQLLTNGPMHVDALAEAVGASVGYVKNCLTTLRTRERAEPVGDGVWRHVSQESVTTI